MKFSECKLGELVVDLGDNTQVGHIVGLTVNYEFKEKGARGEIIPLVQFVGTIRPQGIHYENIRKVTTGESFTG